MNKDAARTLLTDIVARNDFDEINDALKLFNAHLVAEVVGQSPSENAQKEQVEQRHNADKQLYDKLHQHTTRIKDMWEDSNLRCSDNGLDTFLQLILRLARTTLKNIPGSV